MAPAPRKCGCGPRTAKDGPHADDTTVNESAPDEAEVATAAGTPSAETQQALEEIVQSARESGDRGRDEQSGKHRTGKEIVADSGAQEDQGTTSAP